MSAVVLKQGLLANLPATAPDNEMYFTTDTGEVFKGTGTGMSKFSDIITVAGLVNLPATGLSNKLYLVLSSGTVYRWTGTVYEGVKGSTIGTFENNLEVTNHTGSDADGARLTSSFGYGYTAANVLHALGKVSFSHDGSGADQKGKLDIYLNTGAEGSSPSFNVASFRRSGIYSNTGYITPQPDNLIPYLTTKRYNTGWYMFGLGMNIKFNGTNWVRVIEGDGVGSGEDYPALIALTTTGCICFQGGVKGTNDSIVDINSSMFIDVVNNRVGISCVPGYKFVISDPAYSSGSILGRVEANYRAVQIVQGVDGFSNDAAEFIINNAAVSAYLVMSIAKGTSKRISTVADDVPVITTLGGFPLVFGTGSTEAFRINYSTNREFGIGGTPVAGPKFQIFSNNNEDIVLDTTHASGTRITIRRAGSVNNLWIGAAGSIHGTAPYDDGVINAVSGNLRLGTNGFERVRIATSTGDMYVYTKLTIGESLYTLGHSLSIQSSSAASMQLRCSANAGQSYTHWADLNNNGLYILTYGGTYPGAYFGWNVANMSAVMSFGNGGMLLGTYNNAYLVLGANNVNRIQMSSVEHVDITSMYAAASGNTLATYNGCVSLKLTCTNTFDVAEKQFGIIMRYSSNDYFGCAILCNRESQYTWGTDIVFKVSPYGVTAGAIYEQFRIRGNGRHQLAGSLGIGIYPDTQCLFHVYGGTYSVANLRIESGAIPTIDFISNADDNSNRNWKLASVWNAYGNFEILSSTEKFGSPTTWRLRLSGIDGTLTLSGTNIRNGNLVQMLNWDSSNNIGLGSPDNNSGHISLYMASTSYVTELKYGGSAYYQFSASYFYCYPGVSDTTSNGANAVLDPGDGHLKRSTSALKYKTNVIPIPETKSELLYQLNPIMYNDKKAPTGKQYFGMIADDVIEILPELVSTNAEGEPEGISYDRIVVLLVNEVKKLKNRIDQLVA